MSRSGDKGGEMTIVRDAMRFALGEYVGECILFFALIGTILFLQLWFGTLFMLLTPIAVYVFVGMIAIGLLLGVPTVFLVTLGYFGVRRLLG